MNRTRLITIFLIAFFVIATAARADELNHGQVRHGHPGGGFRNPVHRLAPADVVEIVVALERLDRGNFLQHLFHLFRIDRLADRRPEHAHVELVAEIAPSLLELGIGVFWVRSSKKVRLEAPWKL